MDTVFLNDLRIETLVGIYEWERKVPQTIQLDLEIALASSKSCHSDDVADTIDYGAVVARIKEELAQRRFNLLEALSEHLAGMIMTEFAAPWVRISVAKLELIRGVKRVGVTIERGRRDG